MGEDQEKKSGDERLEYGKIQKITFGIGGYQDVMIGYSVELGTKGWGVTQFLGVPLADLGKDKDVKWWDERNAAIKKHHNRIEHLLQTAHVNSMNELVGKPVKVYFKNFNVLDRFELFEELL